MAVIKHNTTPSRSAQSPRDPLAHAPTPHHDPHPVTSPNHATVPDTSHPDAPHPDAPHLARVETVLQQIDSLPTLSPIAARVLRLSSSSDADFDQLTAIIEADPTLSARVLSLCRRAALGISQPITTVRRAATMLGLETLQATLLSVQVYEVLRQHDRALQARDRAALAHDLTPFDRVGFWLHALAVASVAEGLARAQPALRVRPEEAFTAGLLHDLGKLALDWVLPRSYAQVIRLASSRGLSIAGAERAVIGLDHHLAGKRLGEHWGLPHLYLDALWLHGQPPDAIPDLPHAQLIRVVSAADALSRHMHVGWSGSCDTPLEIDQAAHRAGIDPPLAKRVLAGVHDAVADRARTLGLADEPAGDLIIRSVTAANARLASLHASCQSAVAGYRRQAKLLDALTLFSQSVRPGMTLPEVQGLVALSAARTLGATWVGIVWQGRPADQWRIARLHPDGSAAWSRSVEPPHSADGEPIDLRTLDTHASLGDAVGLVTWLSEQLTDPQDPAHAVPATQTPDVRRLRLVSLVNTLDHPAAIGPAGLLVYLAHNPRAQDQDHAATAPIARAWGLALQLAAQHDGARRLAEQLAGTGRALSEAQSQLAEQQSMSRLSELTAGAAHELNNPLTIISGRAQLLLARLSDTKLRQAAAHIAAAAGWMSDLITRLHLIAKPPQCTPAKIDLRKLLESIAQQAMSRSPSQGPTSGPTSGPAPRADRPQITPVRVALEPGVSFISADPALFPRALNELITNALQSNPKTGVTISARLGPEEDELTIRVRDDGAGMSPHALRHAFDPFFSEKPAGRRPGLGLALTRRLIALHHGHIVLDSAPERGTTATITLRGSWKIEPDQPAPKPSRQPKAAPTPRQAHKPQGRAKPRAA